MDGKAAASDQIKALLADPQLMAALKDRLSESSGPAETEQ
jgi:type VI secretion system protein ImpB